VYTDNKVLSYLILSYLSSTKKLSTTPVVGVLAQYGCRRFI